MSVAVTLQRVHWVYCSYSDHPTLSMCVATARPPLAVVAGPLLDAVARPRRASTTSSPPRGATACAGRSLSKFCCSATLLPFTLPFALPRSPLCSLAVSSCVRTLLHPRTSNCIPFSVLTVRPLHAVVFSKFPVSAAAQAVSFEN